MSYGANLLDGRRLAALYVARILQGDHRDKVKKVLVGGGFAEASIELH